MYEDWQENQEKKTLILDKTGDNGTTKGITGQSAGTVNGGTVT